MPINWKTVESQERLLTCVIASLEPAKPNLQRIAQLFGQGLTSGALNWQLRPIREAGKKLIQEAENGTISDVPAAKKVPTKGDAKSKKQNASKENGVMKGRVEKKPRKPKNTKLSRPADEDVDEGWFEDARTGLEDGIDGNHGINIEDGPVYESIEASNARSGVF